MFRPLSESIVFLLLAVSTVRTFVVEGYIISTGSMAPHLLGRYRGVTCPECRFEFAVGVPEGEGNGAPSGKASCANCGFSPIPLDGIDPSDGDQLLVRKDSAEARPPRRWEPTVFRNPANPTQAYVKRIVGLPGESVQLRDGDVWINGRRAVKSWKEQRALRVLVYDLAFAPPSGPDWQPRWVAANSVRRLNDGFEWPAAANAASTIPDSVNMSQAPSNSEGSAALPHTVAADAVVFSPPTAQTAPTDGETAWVYYRHWVRRGGNHRTALPIPGASPVRIPNPVFSPVYFDSERRLLECRGVMPEDVRRRTVLMNPDLQVQAVVNRLAELSHWSPITDETAYNGAPRRPPQEVRDLMISARVRLGRGNGTFAVRMTDGQHWCDATIDAQAREIRLSLDRRDNVVRRVACANRLRPGTSFLLEVSVFDGHAAVAVDGEPVFDAFPLDSATPTAAALSPSAAALSMSSGATPVSHTLATGGGDGGGGGSGGGSGSSGIPFDRPRRVVYLGANRLECRVTELRLYRDVYYRTDSARHGVQPERLGRDEYFVLGDNSPVSLDSRMWATPGVPAGLLIGRPLIVHLPSHTTRIRWLGFDGRFRVPDWGRIRYIR